MYHSITFGSKNTWEDWHLVPTSRPLFLPPKQKKSITDIPGGDGVLDMSEALTGYPVFNNREGSFEFIVMNGYWEWYEAYSTVMEDIHGKTLNAYLEDDTDYYYEGQFEVDQWKSDKNYSTILKTLDHENNCILERYLDSHGKPSVHAAGYSALKREYDADGK